MKTWFLWAVVLFAFSAGSKSAQAVKYNVIDLGSVQGFYAAVPWSINSDGRIVGYVYRYTESYDVEQRAIEFDTTGACNNTILYPGEGSAFGINNSNQIMGMGLFEGGYFATFFDGNNFSSSNTAGINESGLIAVSTSAPSLNSYNVFTCDRNGNMDLIAICPGRPELNGLNDKSQIVGSSGNYNERLAVLFSAEVGCRYLGTLGGDISIAVSINNSGQIVGSAQDVNDQQWATLFCSNNPALNIKLGSVPGTYGSRAISINDAGQIVGFASECKDFYFLTSDIAVLFNPDGSGLNTDLNTLIDPQSGWHLDCATDINNKGWIIGTGMRNGYETPRGFLLRPADYCDAGPQGDVNGDCVVNFTDFAMMAASWMKSNRILVSE